MKNQMNGEKLKFSCAKRSGTCTVRDAWNTMSCIDSVTALVLSVSSIL